MSGLEDHRQRRSLLELAAACAASSGGVPARSLRELQTLVQAAGLAPEDVGADFWRDVRADWLSGAQDAEPFLHAGANAEYAFLAQLRGLLAHCLACGALAAAGSAFCGTPCAALWARAKRAYFSEPPLALPAPACEALLARICGETASPEQETALRRALDGVR